MKNLKNVKEFLETNIKKIIQDNYNIECNLSLDLPPSSNLGDFSTNIALFLSKQLKQNPKAIAELIKTELGKISKEDQNTLSIIDKIEIAGPGFINIFLNHKNFVNSIISEILEKQDKYLNLTIGQDKKLSIEHTAANPNKHLHIGHLRNFSIADTLVRVMNKVGYEVKVQYFNNNQGLQVSKVIWGILNLNKLNLSEEIKSLRLDSLYALTSIQDLKDNIEKVSITNIGGNNPQIKVDTLAARIYVAAEKTITENKEYELEAREIIKQMEQGSNEISEFSDFITEKILLGQIETVSKFGVYYDEIITESAMTQSGEVERIIDALFKTGNLKKEIDGVNKDCIVITNLDSIGGENPDKVLIRADGTAVYTAKDIVFHLWKFGLMNVKFQFISIKTQWNNKDLFMTTSNKDSGEFIEEYADIHINVVDQRQSYPLEIVKQSLKVLGFEKESQNFHHLGYEFVAMSKETAKLLGFISIDNEINNLESGHNPQEDNKAIAMSGRKGMEIPIDYLLDKMTDGVIDANKQKSDILTRIEAEKIAASALRYYMIKYNYNTIIVFDINDALRADGDTGIYLMYAYVRAKSILNKVINERNTRIDEEIKLLANSISCFSEIDPTILELITQISLAQSVLENVAINYEVNKLAEYTYNLAKTFTGFYQKINVSNEQDKDKKILYISIVKSFEIVYKQLLDILGLYTPEKM